MKLFSVAAFILTCAMTVTAQGNPVPLLYPSLVPASVAPGGPGFTLTVRGTGFVAGAVVRWNGSARSTKFVSGSQLTAQIMASDTAVVGTATVTVANPAPGGGSSNAIYFTVVSPLPAVGWMSSKDWGAGGNFAIVGDFDQDGKADVITSLYSMFTGVGEIAVLLGKGDGTFQPAQYYPSGAFSLGIVSGDFNGDGRPDVAVVNANAVGTVSILLNMGGGVFGHPTLFPSGNGAVALTTADFNADGKLDLAVADYNDNTVQVLLGNGDGTFQPGIATPYPSAQFLSAGDVNGDGKPDLIMNSSPTMNISVLLGNGDGTFQAPLPTGSVGSSAPVLADFNGDGKLDLAVPAGTDGIGMLLGHGDGTFGPVTYYRFEDYQLTYLTVADFDGDGKLDVGSGAGFGFAVVFLGNGDGSLRLPAYRFTLQPDDFTGQVVSADFNNDGRMDLAVATNQNTLSVLLQSQVAVSTTYVPFGFHPVGTQTTATVTLTNGSSQALAITGAKIGGRNRTDYRETNTCGSSVAPGASCQFTVTFTPQKHGVRIAALVIEDSSTSRPQRVELKGHRQ